MSENVFINVFIHKSMLLTS